MNYWLDKCLSVDSFITDLNTYNVNDMTSFLNWINWIEEAPWMHIWLKYSIYATWKNLNFTVLGNNYKVADPETELCESNNYLNYSTCDFFPGWYIVESAFWAPPEKTFGFGILSLGTQMHLAKSYIKKIEGSHVRLTSKRRSWIVVLGPGLNDHGYYLHWIISNYWIRE